MNDESEISRKLNIFKFELNILIARTLYFRSAKTSQVKRCPVRVVGSRLQFHFISI
jgi:hypothetical protein